MSPKKKLSSCQSTPLTTTSTRLNPGLQRRTTNATPSASSTSINLTISPSLSQPHAVIPSQHTTTSTNPTDFDHNGSLSATYSYAPPQRPGDPDHQQPSMIAISTHSHTFRNTTQGAQTLSALPFAGVSNSNFADTHSAQSTQRRKGNLVTQSFTSLATGYGPFAASPANAATPGPHRYSPYPDDSSFASSGYSNNLTLHQDTYAIAGNGQQQQLSPFTLSVGASYQQPSTTDPEPSTVTSSMSEALEPFGFPLPSISWDDAPPSFDRVAQDTPGAASLALPLKEDFAEDHPMLTNPGTSSTHNRLSVNTALPVFLSADHTPNSHSSSQADPLSGVDEDMSEEEGKSLARARAKPTKRKRIRKPVERDRARPFEDRYRDALRGAFDALGDALMVLPEEIKPDDFKGKDHTFKPKKGKVLEGSLYVLRTINTVYTELQGAKAREAQLVQEVERLRLHLGNLNMGN